MRKYFWGFGLCGALLAGGSVLVAHHAARHPHSFVGRVMHGATFAASKLSPAAGFGPALASLKKKEAAAVEVEGVPADPEPIEEPSVLPPIALSSAPIVIPDDDTSVATHTPETTFGPATETPASGVAQAPVQMPPCDEEACETLPMPLVEEVDDEEEQEAGSGNTGGASGLFRLFFQMPKFPAPESEEMPPASGVEADPAKEKPDECREDPHHHHHYSGCPYTGRMYRGCPSGSSCPKPSCDPPKKSANGEEEASEEGTDPDSKSALNKIRQFKKREPLDKAHPAHPGVDTLEMRPSDRQLYEYGPSGK